jgi:hypothetical protein
VDYPILLPVDYHILLTVDYHISPLKHQKKIGGNSHEEINPP